MTGRTPIIVDPRYADLRESQALSAIARTVGGCAECARDLHLLREVIEKVGFGIVGDAEIAWVVARHRDPKMDHWRRAS